MVLTKPREKSKLKVVTAPSAEARNLSPQEKYALSRLSNSPLRLHIERETLYDLCTCGYARVLHNEKGCIITGVYCTGFKRKS
jgi:hypothetical protein